MTETTVRNAAPPSRGSALIMAVFVLALVASAGVTLLFVTQTGQQQSQADLRGKRVYFFSEAGLEDGRTLLYNRNSVSADPFTLDEELAVNAGANNKFDFNVDDLVPAFDAAGQLSGLSGYGDDVPLRGRTGFSNGFFASFVTNDPDEVDDGSGTGKVGIKRPDDNNDRVMITSVGAGPARSLEIVQAVVTRRDFFPGLPATITILGEEDCAPDCSVFLGGDSNAKTYTGDDSGPHCPGGDPSLHKPVVGVIGDDSVDSATDGVIKPDTYLSGGGTDGTPVEDLTDDPNLDPMWTDCEALVDFARQAYEAADVVGTSALPNNRLGTAANPKLVFINGDYAVGGNVDGAGFLFVTGILDFDGRASWDGVIFVIGMGVFIHDGAGNGVISGGTIVANVSGPDHVLFTDDDCSGDDGQPGTADDGMGQSIFDGNGAGRGTVGYCRQFIRPWQSKAPLSITTFLQH